MAMHGKLYGSNSELTIDDLHALSSRSLYIRSSIDTHDPLL